MQHVLRQGRVHIFAILLALLVGSIYAAPDLHYMHTPAYQGVSMAGADDSDFYFSVINKSYVSQGFVRDPFHFEYRAEGNPFQYFPIEFVLGKIGAWLHLRLDTLAIICEFVFSALLTLLLYAFAYALSKSRLIACAVAAAMLLGTELVHPNGLSNVINTFELKGYFADFLLYSRPVNPQVSALFFYANLMCLLALFRTPLSRMAIILSGISLGLLAYIYPYFWMFSFTMLGVLFLYAFATRNKSLIYGSLGAGVVCILTMIPFLWLNAGVLLHGSASGLTQIIPSHRFIVEKVLLLPLFLFAIVFFAWRAFFTKYLFVFLLLVAALIVSNQQVLTGKLVEQQHFHFFTNIPLLVLIGVLMFSELMQLVPRIWRLAGVTLLIIVCVWFSVGVQLATYKTHFTESTRQQSLAPVFAYLNAEASTAVVLTGYNIATRVTMYTQDYLYLGGYDPTFLVPHEQLVHDYFVMLALRGVDPKNIKQYLYDHRDEVGSELTVGTYWRGLCGSYGCFADSVLDDLVPQYQAFMSKPLLQNIKTHKIDYILWDRTNDPEWKLASLVQTPPLVESGDFVLYAIHP